MSGPDPKTSLGSSSQGRNRVEEATTSDAAEALTARNVERIQALEAREHSKATGSERVADAIANFSGSIAFVWITVLLIGGWIGANMLLPGRDRLDPFPFPLLTLVLSIEAIFLSIFILMSQNRAARVSDKRSHLDLQLTLLSEQENTKMLTLLEQIGKAVGAVESPDPEAEVLEEATQPEALSRQIDKPSMRGAREPARPGMRRENDARNTASVIVANAVADAALRRAKLGTGNDARGVGALLTSAWTVWRSSGGAQLKFTLE